MYKTARVNPKPGGSNAANIPRVKFVTAGQYISKVRVVRGCQNKFRSFVGVPRLASKDFAVIGSTAAALISLVALSGTTGHAVSRQ